MGVVSTAPVALLVALAACGSSKNNEPARGSSCLPPAAAESGAGIAVVDGVKATACWGGICLDLDREGKVIGPAEMPSPPPPQVQQDRQVGTGAEVRRDPGGQWTLEAPAKGTKVPVGTPGMTLDVFDPTFVVAYQGKRLHLANTALLKETGDFTLMAPIAAVVPWFDRLLIVLEKPAGTAQLDPATATLYQGPELPRCR